MVKGIIPSGLLFLSVTACHAVVADHRAAEITNVVIFETSNQLTIQLSLTASVNPRVVVATDPERLVLELPNTMARAKQQRVAVNDSGVQSIRIGLHCANPPVTRVVLDLDGARSYQLVTEGPKIIWTILAPGSATQAAVQPRLTSRASGAAVVLTKRPASDPSPLEPAARFPPGVRPAGPRQRIRTAFKVKAVAQGAAYLDGGLSSGLTEGMQLLVRDRGSSSTHGATRSVIVAKLWVTSVAEKTAVTKVYSAKRVLRPGDRAYLSEEDIGALIRRAAGNSPVPVASDHDEPPVALLRDSGPRRHSSEVNRLRGRIGADYSGIRSTGSTAGSSTALGISFWSDMTRIGGTYWNLQGYWRGRLTRSSEALEDTMEYYLDRSYTMELYYDNPNSKWRGGLGRLYLPWASVLDTIDGAYVGRKFGGGGTAGVFAGSIPDLNTWHYSPNQRIGGSFVNLEGGDWDGFHYSATTGAGVVTEVWRLDRPFVFIEDSVSYRKLLSAYYSLVVDSPQGISTDGIKPGAGIDRSYLTLHFTPTRRLSFDLIHNYFRDVPAITTQAISTGKVDKFLYQGLLAGVHVEPIRHITLYTLQGSGDKTGDRERSLDQVYGITLDKIWRTGIHADAHYSKFDSPFARGNYKILALSRHLGDWITWDAQIGHQTLLSPFTSNRSSVFVASSFDTNLGRYSFLQSGYTIEHGDQMNYRSWYLSLGYRFDTAANAE
jgi:hypothetical protein